MGDRNNHDVPRLITGLATLPEDDDARVALVPVEHNPVDVNIDPLPANNAGRESTRNKKTRRQLALG